MHLDGWTLLLQTVNLLVLLVQLALLRWLFYRPLIGVIEARRQAVEAERAQAQAARAEAEQRAQQLAEQRTALEASRQQVLDGARQAAEQARELAAQAARAAADGLVAEARQQITHEREAATQALFDEAAALAVALAGRLLAQAPAGGAAGFVDALLARAAATPPAQRERWFAEAGPRRLTLASAGALDPATRESTESRLRALFGNDLQVDVVVDPALIEGAELRLPHGVLALHWAAELAAARAQMGGAAKPAP